MEDDDQVDFRGLLKLIGKLIIEGCLIAAWFCMAVVLQRLIKKFPLEGSEKWVIQIAVWMVDLSTLYQLGKFLFVRHKDRKSHTAWWR